MEHEELSPEEKGQFDQPLETGFSPLSDNQLETVAGGITGKQVAEVEKAIKNAKMLHMSLERAVESLSVRLDPHFPLGSWNQEMLDYLVAHWDEVG